MPVVGPPETRVDDTREKAVAYKKALQQPNSFLTYTDP
jgi:hypothetical protein